MQSLLDSRPLPVYSRHVYSMPYGKHGKHIPRSLSRRPGDDDPRIAPPPACAWICAGSAHPAALQQPAPGGRGLVVPGPAALAESQTGQSPVGRFAFDQPSGAHLRDHQNGNAPGAEGLASFQKGLPLSPSMYSTFSESNRTFNHWERGSRRRPVLPGRGLRK
jgi:hypothetical protein